MYYRPAATLLIIITSLIYLCLPSKILAQSASLNDATDILFDDTAQANTEHNISFTLPENAQNANFSDYINLRFTNYTNLDGSGGYITGQFSGTATFSTNGTQVQITGVNILPGDRVTIRGITASNPISTTDENFRVTITISEDQAGSVIKNFGSAIARLWTGTLTVSANIDTPQGRLDVSGFTAPSTYVVFTEGENIIGTDVAGSTGYFAKVFAALSPTTHTISLYGIDSDDRNTSIVPSTITTPAGSTVTVSNILLSPTISSDDTSYLQGQHVHATGSAYPGSTVTIFTDSPLRTYTASASALGAWTTSITNTSAYNPGDYRLYTIAQSTQGYQSLTSPRILFTISSSSGDTGTACGDITQGDLNCDGDINLTDFSIMMYYWGTADNTADVNSDGIVDITDFSILMYYWGSI